MGQPQLPHHRTCGSASGGSGQAIRGHPNRTAESEDPAPGIPCFPSERYSSKTSPNQASTAPMSFPRSNASRSVRPFAPVGFPTFDATMASADFPRHFLLGISPGKNALLPSATAAFTSATEPAALLCCASSPRRGRP